jgi:hypothetical protein
VTQRQQRTLAFCNRVRVALGKKPRQTLAKGELSDPEKCPIARTICEYGIKATSQTLVAQFGEDRTLLSGAGFDVSANGYIDLPLYARDFVRTFDSGGYPELIKS